MSELDPVDIYVGSKIRNRRLLCNLSQDNLAKAIGLTFQQVQKYERGTNRMSVSRLMDLSKALKLHFTWLMEGLDKTPKNNQLPQVMCDKEIQILNMVTKLTDDEKKHVVAIVKTFKKKGK